MASNAERRLLRDLKKIQGDNSLGEEISANPSEDSLYKWDAIIFGPSDTIWEDGIF